LSVFNLKNFLVKYLVALLCVLEFDLHLQIQQFKCHNLLKKIYTYLIKLIL